MTTTHTLTALATAARREEALLAALPPRPDRGAAQQRDLDDATAEARRLRTALMAGHAEQVYDELTEGGTVRHRLTPLVHRAAERFPGLVPGRDRMAAEERRAQRDKDGLEIDQAIFVHGVLAAPRCGGHLLDTMRLPTPAALALLEEFRRTGRADLGPVVLERRPPACHLTMTDPATLNAETNELVAAMETAVDLALLDPEVRVGVLRGGAVSHRRYAGRRVFSSGINLVHLHQGRISYLDFLIGRELGLVNKLLRGLYVPGAVSPARDVAQKPWIGAVDTFAIGGGMQLLFVMDRVIAAHDASFSLPAAREGIVPGAGNLRLPRFVGNRIARQVVLTGRAIRADEPAARLICDDVVEPGAVDAAVETAVEELAAPAVAANRAMLTAAEEPPDVFRAYMAEFALHQGARLYAPDVLDKVSAFSAARPGQEVR
ncbi:enoyl-CoA hydratase/isomerase family protein [Streptomyces roseirectus]|uniref:Enoyl-CoA hydratase/isomerase family protein n=1 Tax=Streptomyces roseirectus TaxID=2768066 RepID=A0A7H0IQN2_9ACTN|nr:(3,5-dihydroxyphenyl)acetyl-CoA 1,2-dioxygenase DpgC [Streptomyces roseirectus]QNP75098.1 enoyl-CoA hydratase/isomerase family protein [Streptomyces roseirectus]